MAHKFTNYSNRDYGMTNFNRDGSDRKLIEKDWFHTRWVDKHNFERDWFHHNWVKKHKFDKNN